MANEKLCDVHGLGDVCLIFDNDFKLTLKDIRHVPDLAHSLISYSAFEEEGLERRWGKGVMKVMKGSLTIFKAERKKNLYDCTVKHDSFVSSVLKTSKTDLWHKRDRERRESRIPSKFRDFHLALNTEYLEPSTYDEALKSPDSKKWLTAMKEEIKSLHDNKIWILVFALGPQRSGYDDTLIQHLGFDPKWRLPLMAPPYVLVSLASGKGTQSTPEASPSSSSQVNPSSLKPLWHRLCGLVKSFCGIAFVADCSEPCGRG
ncbi:UNVERIFIED_CONTAM: hypothetical protein Scaly_2036400 [Sesamum calycinum]|uniref:Retrovirus-related Pol polyprotein from transposon TNT 1-94-like beta-barrel domain-containing protein n=1 Tax=Sesamum calycinum TaxID=2727403 RepID=A0AAW2N3P3_9LAMI